MPRLWLGALSLCMLLPPLCSAVSLRDLIHRATVKRGENFAQKRTGECPPWEPFQCPDGDCVPIKYLCDGSLDCASGYDENDKMCTAATRPPVEETANFLRALTASHGKDFLAKIFGKKAKDNLAAMGGVEEVAVALSQSPTAGDFGTAVGMTTEETDNMEKVLSAIVQGDTAGFGGSEASDIQFYAKKLHDTGFF